MPKSENSGVGLANWRKDGLEPKHEGRCTCHTATVSSKKTMIASSLSAKYLQKLGLGLVVNAVDVNAITIIFCFNGKW